MESFSNSYTKSHFTAPKAGNYHFQIADKMTYPNVLSLMGQTLMAISFALLSPSPIFGMNLAASSSTLGMSYGIASAFGIGFALVTTSTFSRCYQVCYVINCKMSRVTSL
jgi:uncharacterized membrane protein YjjP (DUF1212 family)